MVPPRIDTTHWTSVSLTLPAGPVTFKFPQPSAHQYHTVISIPPNSKWTPGLHWHEQYDEFFRVRQGRVLITIDGQRKIYTPTEGVVRIPKFARHEFMRADALATSPADRELGWVEVEEWTEPDDGFHEVFFRNVMSILAASTGLDLHSTTTPGAAAPAEGQDVSERRDDPPPAPRLSLSLVLQLWTSIAYLDNYVVLAPGPVGHYIIHAIYKLGSWIGNICGLRPWYVEYTPERLRAVALAGPGGLARSKMN